MIALLSLMLSLHSDVVCPPMGCPDYEAQRAAEIDDSLTYLQDSLAECRPAAHSLAAHSLALPAEPVLVSVATRGNVSEPERATTCYVGLDCPE